MIKKLLAGLATACIFVGGVWMPYYLGRWIVEPMVHEHHWYELVAADWIVGAGAAAALMLLGTLAMVIGAALLTVYTDIYNCLRRYKW